VTPEPPALSVCGSLNVTVLETAAADRWSGQLTGGDGIIVTVVKRRVAQLGRIAGSIARQDRSDRACSESGSVHDAVVSVQCRKFETDAAVTRRRAIIHATVAFSLVVQLITARWVIVEVR